MSVLNGPGEGTWSVFAAKVVEERDEARHERDEARQRLERLLDKSADGWMARALDAERERDEWRSECASISEEFNLPAGIRPSEGEISQFLKDYEKARKERDEALAKYQFMVDRAAGEKLDGYRELESKLEAMEAERDKWRSDYLNFCIFGH